MSELTDAVSALKNRVVEDVTHLQSVIQDLTGQLVEALSNDAADAATIAAKQAELDALNTEVAGVVSDLNAVDPVADFPPAPEPEPEPAPEG